MPFERSQASAESGECPSEEAIAAFTAGQATDEEREALRQHIDTCPACVALVAAAFGQAGAESPPSLEVGDRVGAYRIDSLLGRGATGLAYVAVDERLGRRVAIKMLRAEAQGSADRFFREARALAALRHPNIVMIHDVGVHGDRPYLVTELIDGPSLREWIAQGRSRREIVHAFGDVARGLAALHDAGFVHRDVKPENIVAHRDGRFVIIDLGLVRRAGDTQDAPSRVWGVLAADDAVVSHSRTGAVLGTPAYMSPEQLRGSTDPRSDQFSFCISLYEALTGERPAFDRDVGRAGARDPAAYLDAKWRAQPKWLRRIVERGLRDDPLARFPSMERVGGALARRNSPLARVGLVAAVLVVALAALTAAFFTTPQGPVRIRLEPARGALRLPMERAEQGRVAFVQVPEGRGDVWDPSALGAGAVTIETRVPRAGTYVLWGRVRTPRADDDSFYLEVNGSGPILWDLRESVHWVWDRVRRRGDSTSTRFELERGPVRIVVAQRKDGAQLDELILTDDLGFAPPGAVIWRSYEAESMRGLQPVVTDRSAASGRYVHLDASEHASFQLWFDVEARGRYRVWVRSRVPGALRAEARMEGDRVEAFRMRRSGEWTLQPVGGASGGPRAFDVSAGEHVLLFTVREGSVDLDRFIVTGDPALRHPFMLR